MYKVLFKSRKAALVYAVLTLLGAIRLVGTSENDGVLDQPLAQLEQQRRPAVGASAWTAPAPRGVDPAAAPAPGTGPVFGDYVPVSREAGDATADRR